MDESNLIGDQLDVVKRNIYGYWVTASRYRTLIHKQMVQVPDLDSYNYESDFKSSVLELYFACEPKLNYHNNTDCVKNMRKLEPIQPGVRFKLSTAEALFRLLTEFIELDGITKFEKDVHVSKPY